MWRLRVNHGLSDSETDKRCTDLISKGNGSVHCDSRCSYPQVATTMAAHLCLKVSLSLSVSLAAASPAVSSIYSRLGTTCHFTGVYRLSLTLRQDSRVATRAQPNRPEWIESWTVTHCNSTVTQPQDNHTHPGCFADWLAEILMNSPRQ